MAQRTPKDIISRLADAGEEALHKMPDIPVASRLMEATSTMRERLDDLTKKVRGIDALEKRVAKLEKQLSVQGGATRKKTAEVAKTTSRARTGTGTPARKRSTSSTTRKKTS